SPQPPRYRAQQMKGRVSHCGSAHHGLASEAALHGYDPDQHENRCASTNIEMTNAGSVPRLSANT
ncbi:MAG TPA: hypothetical protein VN939_14540, partial [Chthoniobacterales bacterium]|nr:hypothetical protein [Chthoniobacterales bacterium]